MMNLAPHKQKDADMFLRIVEVKENGIVVRGAKAHQTLSCVRIPSSLFVCCRQIVENQLGCLKCHTVGKVRSHD